MIFAPFDLAGSREAFGRWPDPSDTQPLKWAGAGDPAALLLYGTHDTVVQSRNSQALAAKLRASGVPEDLRSYQKLGHVGILLALARPFRERAPVLADASAFVRRVSK